MGSPIPVGMQVDNPPFIRRIAIVYLYGCDLQSPLKHYLDDIAAWCNAERPSVVILCGGPTQQKQFPGKTEAKVAYNYLSHSLAYVPEWFLEDKSFTSRENAESSAEIVALLKERSWRGTVPRHDEITIWCELTRGLKVAILTRHFLGFPPERKEPNICIKTDSWELAHPTSMLIGTVKDWLAITFPFLNTLHSWYRRLIRAPRI